MAATDYINGTNVEKAASSALGEIIKKIIFFSAVVVQKIVEWLGNIGIPLHTWQVSVLFALVDLLFIFIVVRYITKPILKIVIVILLVWFLLGFFIPIN